MCGCRAWRDLAAVRHPDAPHEEGTDVGLGRRLLFQRVPEEKTAKNRLHIDVHAGPGRGRAAEVARPEGQGGRWTVMAARRETSSACRSAEPSDMRAPVTGNRP